MATIKTLVTALILVAAAAGCVTSDHSTGKACERCSRGYYPVDGTDHRRAVCIAYDRVMNCDRIPADCPECAGIQRRDMEAAEPPVR